MHKNTAINGYSMPCVAKSTIIKFVVLFDCKIKITARIKTLKSS